MFIYYYLFITPGLGAVSGHGCCFSSHFLTNLLDWLPLANRRFKKKLVGGTAVVL